MKFERALLACLSRTVTFSYKLEKQAQVGIISLNRSVSRISYADVFGKGDIRTDISLSNIVILLLRRPTLRDLKVGSSKEIECGQNISAKPHLSFSKNLWGGRTAILLRVM